MTAPTRPVPRIYRDQVPVDGEWHDYRLRGPIVHVACRTPYAVEFWYLNDPDAEPVTRTLQVFGTGQAITADDAVPVYVDTAVVPGGQLVWHLIERTAP